MMRALFLPSRTLGFTLLLLTAPACCKSDAPPAKGTASGSSKGTEQPMMLGEVDGWQLEGEVRRYPRRQLFKHINGGAELYLQQGFHHSETVSYARQGKGRLRVNLFEMNSPRGAFGIFSTERPAGAVPSEAVKSGYHRDQMLAFWHGRFYVKIVAAELAGAESAGLAPLASSISGMLGAGSEPPTELELLPDQGRVKGSERLTARDFIGSPAFRQVLSAQYTLGKREATLFLTILPDEKGAKEALARHKKLVLREGGTARDLETGQSGLLQLKHDGLGYCLLTRTGKIIAGLHAEQPPTDDAAARQLLKNLISRLSAR